MRPTALWCAMVFWSSVALAQQAQPANQVLTPAAASQRLNEKVTIQMLVLSTGGNTNRFLNSTANYRDASNFTVFIPETAVESFKKANIDNPAEYYRGKTVQVTGVVSLYQDKPQIRVEDPAQIKLVPQK